MKRHTKPPNNYDDFQRNSQKRRNYDSPPRLLNSRQGKLAFSEIILTHTALPRGAEPLALLDYDEEKMIKCEALAEFSQIHKISKFAELVATPKPRFYRTTTKRKVLATHQGPMLAFGDERSEVKRSMLDLEEHSRIYAYLQKAVRSPAARKFIASLTHVIIRGSTTEFCIIFNVARRSAAFSALLVNWVKELSEEMPAITSALEFLDETRSDYYLDSDAKNLRGAWKRLFGNGLFDVSAGRKIFRVSAKVFSQVNQSMLPIITCEVERLLHPEGQPLVDLFCGYGLFAISLAAKSGRVIGIENDADAVRLAQKNAELLNVEKARFYKRYINDETFAELLPYGRTREIFVLDPPRQGVDDAVIEAIAERKPMRIAHIFCNIEELPKSLKIWKSFGYVTAFLVPLDMFAGTASVEVIALLEQQ